MNNNKYLTLSPIVGASKESNTGISYNYAKGVDEDVFLDYVEEMINLAKTKGLTVRQAQILFQVCVEYVLDCTSI